MSEFDKEAERERLREKYERDQKKREVTEKMSELLLQGATMTNAHCQDCGDPIFRYDGQEFCPTCEKPVERGTGADGADGSDGDEAVDDRLESAEDGEQIEVAAPSDSARVRFGGDADGQDAGAEDETPQPGSPRERVGGPDAARKPAAAVPEPTPADDSELARSRAALHQRLRDLTQRAGACEDPREAEAYMAAAREAAEALAALRR